MAAYSVLMTVYNKEKPEHLYAAVTSMADQTAKPDDFVIVCDGPLTRELDAVLEALQKQYPELFHIVRLPENVGIGAAANAGLQHCRQDLVAKMDADDIAVPTRCEKQLALFSQDPELTVVGGYIEEFDQDPEKPFAVRSVPRNNADIRQYARRRQPFNNTTVMYRRSAVLAVGGYRDFRRNEDYDLYLRLLHAGYPAANLPETLVKVRVDSGALSRRASFGTLKGCVRSRWYAFRIGYSSFLDFLFCAVGELVIVISPPKVQNFIYRRFLRTRCAEEAEPAAARGDAM